MFSTREVLACLRAANPSETITEDRIRNVLRRGDVSAPPFFAGRYVWSRHLILNLAEKLGLHAPSYSDFQVKVNE